MRSEDSEQSNVGVSCDICHKKMFVTHTIVSRGGVTRHRKCKQCSLTKKTIENAARDCGCGGYLRVASVLKFNGYIIRYRKCDACELKIKTLETIVHY